MHPTPLPGDVEKLFWDYDPGVIRWAEDHELVIRRVLSDGSWSAVTWLRAQMGDDALRAWIIANEGRWLSPRQLRFWELVLHLPHDLADAWVAERRNTIWERRTTR